MKDFPFGELDHFDPERLPQPNSPDLLEKMHGLFLLGRSAANLLEYVQSVADRCGLPLARMRVLTALRFQITEEDATPAFLAEKLQLSRSNITGLLDGLERKGLLERIHDSTDRRSIRLKLTSKGDVLAQKWFAEVVEATQRLSKALEKENFDPEKAAFQIERALKQAGK